ncbi:MAG: radical SAM family heme chaperone HemW [bacterium]
MNKSVYVHIPFCTKICTYCDFPKMLYKEDFVLRYLISLEKEIKEYYNHEQINTLYIGGGTPSSLKIGELKKLFTCLELFNISSEAEITFECNLTDIRDELLQFLKANKINRLSIGIQSFNKKNLELLGRDSDYSEAKFKIDLCRKYGFENINVDLMYALPSESMKILKKDIKQMLKLGVEHISTYSLIIEDNTILKLNNTQYISDVVDSNMYKKIKKKLKNNSYNHYEVSNFAKKGYESQHNTVYWNNSEYYGFGLGAAGYYEGVRYENTKSLTEYINGKYRKEENLLSKKETMDYELMLGFRKMMGINLEEFQNKFDEDLLKMYPIEEQIKKKNIIKEGSNVFINPKKIYLMNEILIKLI